MTTTPLLSVLIRSIGLQGALQDALLSLQEQTYRHFEVILIEDGPETLTRFLQNFPDITLHYTALGKRKGRSVAGNEAMARAQGEYFIFLDEDDVFYPTHLETLIKTALTEEKAFVYSYAYEKAVARDSEGEIVQELSKIRPPKVGKFSYLQLLQGNLFPIHTVLFHRSYYEVRGGFDPQVDMLEDWLLWVNYLSLLPQAAPTGEYTAEYRVPYNLLEFMKRRKALRAAIPAVQQRMEQLEVHYTIPQLIAESESLGGLCQKLRKILRYGVFMVRKLMTLCRYG